ncbi:hypothetical protein RX327_26210 [Bradyrhizobium sp. BEA-2-5]|uniref:hypothetical protein n=1 Tax=Bradyrhizobium sp. BEA-2-5 TaxID=3080015 RepID=UPI00293E569A|nr:hypothetical protein [Bradyrhizobium sp. BEA-2-5]WOH85561.1 hypothetical protein RX327_26210 [Bradyrhizobium sp. BEA-2-5]
MIVGAGEPAEIAAVADAVAGQEEAGVGGLRRRRRRRHDDERKTGRNRNMRNDLHLNPPDGCYGPLRSTRRPSGYSGAATCE